VTATGLSGYMKGEQPRSEGMPCFQPGSESMTCFQPELYVRGSVWESLQPSPGTMSKRSNSSTPTTRILSGTALNLPPK